MDAQTVVQQSGLADFVVRRNTTGITHEESLVLPRPGGNCLNWVVGHLTRTRNEVLGLLGAAPLYPAEDFEVYGAGGETRVRADNAIPLPELLERFDKLGEAVRQGLARTPSEAFTRPAPFSPTGDPEETTGSLVVGIAFHEAYHAGQTGILRRLLGHRGALPAPGEHAADAPGAVAQSPTPV